MSTSYVIDEQVSGPNALRVEHEREHVGAYWYGDVGDVANDSGGECVLSIFGSGFSKELPGSTRIDVRSVDNGVRARWRCRR